MAFIQKIDPVVLNIKLTSKGRELLSTGNLNFKYFVIGDSEIDYEFNNETGLNPFDSIILRPSDNNPKIISFIPKSISGDPYNVIPSVPTSWYPITNNGQSIGFFNEINPTGGSFTFNIDPNHVKQGGCMVHMAGITGGTALRLRKSSLFIPPNEPVVGDLLLVKWTLNGDTTPLLTDRTKPTPFLIYKITGITGGTLMNDNLTVFVDRELPNFEDLAPTGRSGAIVYYGSNISFSGDTILDDTSIDYLDESVFSFLSNSKCPTVIFPFWNMSVIFTEEIAGVQFPDRKFGQFNSAPYGGFVSYIQSQAATLKKLGVIHYTNSSPANVYAEGFYRNTAILDIPTIMWHKSGTVKLGARFKCAKGNGFTLVNLGIHYYDLVDATDETIIVGKVFDELKMFLIEDPELLFAMSYKSNRTWTLPEFILGGGGGACAPVPAPQPEVLFVQTVIGQPGSIKGTGGQNIPKPETITEYGVEYKLASLPDVPENWIRISRTVPLETNGFSIDIEDTLPNTQYAYRSYVKIGVNEFVDKISNLSITTLPAVAPPPPPPPVIIPSVATSVGSAGIGQIIGVGGNSIPANVFIAIEKYGMEYKQSNLADVPSNWTTSPAAGLSGPLAQNSFTVNISGLAEGTSYDYRAFIQVAGFTYRSGSFQSTTTTATPAPQYFIPEATTGVVFKQISRTSGIDAITKNNYVSSNGGTVITEYGLVYSQNPVDNDPLRLVYGGSGINKVSVIGDYPDVSLPFTITMSNLLDSSPFYFRAFAINSAGIGYGELANNTAIPVVVVPQNRTVFVCEATQTGSLPTVTNCLAAKIGVSSPLNSGESIILHLTSCALSDTISGNNQALMSNIRAESYYTIGGSTTKNNLASSSMPIQTQDNCNNQAYTTLTITSDNINSICLHANAFSTSKNGSYSFTNLASISITQIENAGGANYSLGGNFIEASNTGSSGTGGGGQWSNIA